MSETTYDAVVPCRSYCTSVVPWLCDELWQVGENVEMWERERVISALLRP